MITFVKLHMRKPIVKTARLSPISVSAFAWARYPVTTAMTETAAMTRTARSGGRQTPAALFTKTKISIQGPPYPSVNATAIAISATMLFQRPGCNDVAGSWFSTLVTSITM